uniref:Ig-like domain-containing protein n=1 Tax=Chelydra serpentina TaxID=8475 RepID=A0A8C3XNV4_CHESE
MATHYGYPTTNNMATHYGDPTDTLNNMTSEMPSRLTRVTEHDFPPRPALSVDPPSRAVSEGLPLLITCTAPVSAGERRFHFYKDGAKLSRPGSMMLSIPRAGPHNAGEFTCAYEENVSGRRIPSLRSLAVNVTVTGEDAPDSPD